VTNNHGVWSSFRNWPSVTGPGKWIVFPDFRVEKASAFLIGLKWMDSMRLSCCVFSVGLKLPCRTCGCDVYFNCMLFAGQAEAR
jgi:hypothetical protein